MNKFESDKSSFKSECVCLGMSGSFVGTQDSIQRIAGILAPLLVSRFPTFYDDVYLGALFSGAIYFAALLFVTTWDNNEPPKVKTS